MIHRESQMDKAPSCSKNDVDARFPYNSFGTSEVAMHNLEKEGDCIFLLDTQCQVPVVWGRMLSDNFHSDSSNDLEFPY